MCRTGYIAVGVGLFLGFLSCGDDVVESTGPLTIADDFCHGRPDGTICDDGSSCTEADVCGLGVCRGQALPDFAVCDDGQLCSLHDYCSAGDCVGIAKDCDPGGPCLAASCDAITGECVKTPAFEGETCSDGEICTSGDHCGAGLCTGTPLDCSDLNGPCQIGVCQPGAGGACASVPVADGTACGDGTTCTLDLCAAGTCASTPKCGSLDGPCRYGVCDTVTGECRTENKSDGGSCEDGNPCTVEESCAGGSCLGGSTLPDGSLCDDADPCTLVGLCDGGACAASRIDCSSLDTPCATGQCDSATGACTAVVLANGSSCDDGEK